MSISEELRYDIDDFVADSILTFISEVSFLTYTTFEIWSTIQDSIGRRIRNSSGNFAKIHMKDYDYTSIT